MPDNIFLEVFTVNLSFLLGFQEKAIQMSQDFFEISKILNKRLGKPYEKYLAGLEGADCTESCLRVVPVKGDHEVYELKSTIKFGALQYEVIYTSDCGLTISAVNSEATSYLSYGIVAKTKLEGWEVRSGFSPTNGLYAKSVFFSECGVTPEQLIVLAILGSQTNPDSISLANDEDANLVSFKEDLLSTISIKD